MSTYVGNSGGYYGDASRGGAYQPINYVISQLASSTGTATFLFDAVALSNTWTLTINCAGAPDTALWVASSGGTSFGQFKGSNSWGPLQLQGGDRLQVTATGLVPGTTYNMAGYGYCNTVNEPEIIYPTAYADSVTTSTQQIYLGKGSFSSTAVNVSVTVQPTWRSIYFVATSIYALPAITLNAVGNQSGFTYSVITVPYNLPGTTNQIVYRVPIINGLDTSITLTTNGSQAFNFWYGADLANIDVAVYPEGTFNVTPSNTSSTPLWVESVAGSVVTPSNTSSTPLWVESVAGSTTYVTNPSASGSHLNAAADSVFGAKGTVTGANTVTFSIPLTPTNGGPNFRSVWIVSTYANTFTACVGNNSGLTYVPYSIINPYSTGYAWRIPILYGIDTSISVTLIFAGAPSNWTYWYGYDTADTNLAIQSQSSSGITVSLAGSYVQTARVTNSSNLTMAVSNSAGITEATVTTTGTTATQLIAAPAAGQYIRLQSVTMYYTGTASVTPVIGRFLAGSTNTLFTLAYPYENTIIANGQVLPAATALYVAASTSTSTIWVATYDILSNVAYS